jgi:hypothetical protein
MAEVIVRNPDDRTIARRAPHVVIPTASISSARIVTDDARG